MLRDLKDHDTQSHGHFHHVYRDPEANRVNLERAHRILASFGIRARRASPRRTADGAPGLDDALEDFGYLYSSDFQLGYDDFPFFPWKGDRFSRVLQVPVHPVCEGLFLEAGITDGQAIGEYLASAVAARLDAGELAIAYGHPERRLGRMPEVLAALARAVDRASLVWRVDVRRARALVALAGRAAVAGDPPRGHRLEIQFAEWDAEYADGAGDPPRRVLLLGAR